MNRTYLLHGFTQSAGSWKHVLPRVPGATALDLPGHGTASTHTPGFDAGVGSLVARGGAGNWVGYSMGGRYALHVALAEPHLVDRLVLVGAHPGIEDPAERNSRLERDQAMASHIERVGVTAFLDEWLSQPLFEALPPEARGLEYRRLNSAAGLAAALRRASVGLQGSLWRALTRLSMPVLYVAGERDAKYRAIGERVVDRLGPQSHLAVVTGAGHAVPFENPTGFVEALVSWHPGFGEPQAASGTD